MNTEALTEKVGKREVLALAWPAILEMSLHMLAWIVDTAMVGRLGAAALSAVGLGGQVYFSLAFFLGAVGVGATALVARHKGARDTSGASHVAEQGLFLGLVFGALMTAILLPNARRLYDLVGLGSEVGSLGTAYVRTASLGALFFLPTMVANGIMRGMGDTRTPLYVTLVTNIVNIVGDYLLIYGHLGLPRMGVAGAALALLAGQVVGGLLALWALFRRADPPIRLAGVLRPRVASLRRILSLSIPAGMETVLMDGARTVSTFIIASMGTVSMAAHQVAITAESLSFMPGYGFAIAASIITGQSLGAGKPRRAEEGTRQSWLLGLMTMSAMGLVFFLFPRQLVALFTVDREVIDLAARCLQIAAVMQPAIATTEVFTGALRGAGDTRTAMYVTALGSWAVRVPLIVVAVYVLHLSLVTVWLAMVAEWTVRALLVRWVFTRGRWRALQV